MLLSDVLSPPVCLATIDSCRVRFFNNCLVELSIVSRGTFSLSASSSIEGALPVNHRMRTTIYSIRVALILYNYH